MSVRTTADEKLDAAREAVQTALVALSDIIVDECYGHDEYKPEFRQQLGEAFGALLAVRGKLK